MHEALSGLGLITETEVHAAPDWQQWLQALAADGRATRLELHGAGLWVATERLPQAAAVYPGAVLHPPVEVPREYAETPWSNEQAMRELLRSRLSGLGPMRADELAAQSQVPVAEIEVALLGLQNEGYVLQGNFTPGCEEIEWCERHLLARIHRYTLKRLRQEIEPVEPRDFARFLFDWQHLSAATRVNGPEALSVVLGQL